MVDYDELKEAVFSIIKDDDPYIASKQLQVIYWCGAFLNLFGSWGETKLPFFLDVLLDEKCWEKTNTIHGIKLNRRIAAKKMVEPRSWNAISNPLDDFERYQVSCWCCLEEEIVALFEHFKQEDKIKDGDTASLKKLVKSVSGNYCTDPMMEYWSYVVSGYAPELKLEGRHLYVYGLHCVLGMWRKRLEAVEFFWSKIKSLPEHELSAEQKDEVFMKTAVRAAGNGCNSYPEVFEFCFSQISLDKYPELLKRDLAENGRHDTLFTLKERRSFNNLKVLFEHLQPNNILEHDYYTLLRSIEIKNYLEYYANAGAELFIYIWMKEGFSKHRVFTLHKEMSNFPSKGKVLEPLVSKNYMEPVWAVLDKANPDQIKEFMGSRQAEYMRSMLKERGDENSLNKFLSYDKSTVEELENPRASLNHPEHKSTRFDPLQREPSMADGPYGNLPSHTGAFQDK